MEFKGVRRMKAREKHAEKLVEYLANPANEWLDKTALSVEVLQRDRSYISKVWTAQQFDEEIGAPALELRRSRLAPISAKVDRMLVDKALGGDVQAIKLFYQRLEGWSPSKKTELVGKIDGQLTLADVLNGTVDEA
jgi:hypothetical protein